MSVSSIETTRSSGSEISFSSVLSRQSSHDHSVASGQSGSSWSKGTRRRRRRPAVARKQLSSNEDRRPYECTFCTDSFKTKYDWQRHEKSLHLSLESWQYALLARLFDALVQLIFATGALLMDQHRTEASAVRFADTHIQTQSTWKPTTIIFVPNSLLTSEHSTAKIICASISVCLTTIANSTAQRWNPGLVLTMKFNLDAASAT